MYYVKNGLNMSYMQAKYKKSEVNTLGMQILKTYLTWTINAILHEMLKVT